MRAKAPLAFDSREAIAYLRAAGVCAIVWDGTRHQLVTDCRRITAPNKAATLDAIWVADRKQAMQVVRACSQGRAMRAAARAAGISFTEHHVAISRAAHRAHQLSDLLDRMKSKGHLTFFNGEYRRRRRAAQIVGRRFMTYAEAERRLRAAVIRRGLNLKVSNDIVTEVFG